MGQGEHLLFVVFPLTVPTKPPGDPVFQVHQRKGIMELALGPEERHSLLTPG